MALRRSVPFLPSSSVGSSALWAPRFVVSSQARGHVIDGERDVVHPVPVLRHVLRDLAVGRERRGEHEADVVLDHHEAGPIAHAGLEPGVRHRREAPQRAVVVRGLLGVADPELDVVDAVERQEVLRLVGGVGIDDRAGLVGRAAGDRIGHGRLTLPQDRCRLSPRSRPRAPRRSSGRWPGRAPRAACRSPRW